MFNAVVYTPVVYGSYDYPKWAEMLGWMQVTFALGTIPVYMLYILRKNAGSWQVGRRFRDDRMSRAFGSRFGRAWDLKLMVFKARSRQTNDLKVYTCRYPIWRLALIG